MRQEWVVVIEGVCSPATLDLPALQRLLQRVGDCSPVALHDPNRCALQLQVTAVSSSEALNLALDRWNVGVRELWYLQWEVVRVEVMTLEEFGRDCEIAYGRSESPLSAGPDLESRELPVGDALLRRAFEDELTGLQTPGLFAFEVEEAARRARAAKTTTAVVVLDLDGFKAVNERWGPEAGDQLLLAVADRLVGVLGGAKNVARLGGDRFAVLLERSSEDRAVSTAWRFLEALRATFHLGVAEVALGASVGVAAGTDADVESLMENATAALLTAKISNRGGLHVFDGDDALDQAARDDAGSARSRLGASLRLLRRAAALAESGELSEAAASVLPHLCHYAGSPLAQLCMFDAGVRGFRPTSTWYSSDSRRFGGVQDENDRASAPLEGEVYGQVTAGRRPVWSELEGGVTGDSPAIAAGLHAVVVVPVLAGNEIVAGLQFFLEGRQKPDAAVLDTLALVGINLGQVTRRTDMHASGSRGEALLRALVRRSSDLIMVIDHDFNCRSQPLPDGGDHWQGVSFDRFVHPEDVAQARIRISEAMASESPQPPFECRMLRKDGSWCWMTVLATNLFDEDSVGGLLLSARQIRQPASAGDMPTEAGVSFPTPLRYELFAWEPEQPAPGLDAFVARPQARTGGRTDLWNALTVAYERLAGAVISRSRSTAEDRQDEG